MAFTTKADFEARAAARLAAIDAVFEPPQRTDYDLNPDWPAPVAGNFRKAAVLIGLIDRRDDYGVLLTLRPETMSSHAGQVAFPGGVCTSAPCGDEPGALQSLPDWHTETGIGNDNETETDDPRGCRHCDAGTGANRASFRHAD